MRWEDPEMLLKLTGSRMAVGHDWEIQSQKGLCWGCEQDAATRWGLDGLVAALLCEAGQTSVTSPATLCLKDKLYSQLAKALLKT